MRKRGDGRWASTVAVFLVILVSGLAQGLRGQPKDQQPTATGPALPMLSSPNSQIGPLTPSRNPIPSLTSPPSITPSATDTATLRPSYTPAATAKLQPSHTPTTGPRLSLPMPTSLLEGERRGGPTKGRTRIELYVIPAAELPQPHLWLERPFASSYRQWAEQTYPYGSRGDGRYVLHTGVDIVNPMDTPVLSVAEGWVIYAGNDAQQAIGPELDFFGNAVVVRLTQELAGEPVFVLYGHLNTIAVTAGQLVSVGSVIGTVGMTGIAVGPHLHLEVRVGQNSYLASRNPEFWLRPLPGHGILAGRYLNSASQPLPGQRLLVYKLERLDRVWQVLYTYPADDEINSDSAWQENFLLADIPAGEYLLETAYEGALGRLPFVIVPGQITFVEIRIG